jgi:hypothetical protein
MSIPLYSTRVFEFGFTTLLYSFPAKELSKWSKPFIDKLALLSTAHHNTASWIARLEMLGFATPLCLRVSCTFEAAGNFKTSWHQKAAASSISTTIMHQFWIWIRIQSWSNNELILAVDCNACVAIHPTSCSVASNRTAIIVGIRCYYFPAPPAPHVLETETAQPFSIAPHTSVLIIFYF